MNSTLMRGRMHCELLKQSFINSERMLMTSNFLSGAGEGGHTSFALSSDVWAKLKLIPEKKNKCGRQNTFTGQNMCNYVYLHSEEGAAVTARYLAHLENLAVTTFPDNVA